MIDSLSRHLVAIPSETPFSDLYALWHAIGVGGDTPQNRFANCVRYARDIGDRARSIDGVSDVKYISPSNGEHWAVLVYANNHVFYLDPTLWHVCPIDLTSLINKRVDGSRSFVVADAYPVVLGRLSRVTVEGFGGSVFRVYREFFNGVEFERNFSAVYDIDQLCKLPEDGNLGLALADRRKLVFRFLGPDFSDRRLIVKTDALAGAIVKIGCDQSCPISRKDDGGFGYERRLATDFTGVGFEADEITSLVSTSRDYYTRRFEILGVQEF